MRVGRLRRRAAAGAGRFPFHHIHDRLEHGPIAVEFHGAVVADFAWPELHVADALIELLIRLLASVDLDLVFAGLMLGLERRGLPSLEQPLQHFLRRQLGVRRVAQIIRQRPLVVVAREESPRSALGLVISERPDAAPLLRLPRLLQSNLFVDLPLHEDLIIVLHRQARPRGVERLEVLEAGRFYDAHASDFFAQIHAPVG